MVDEESTYVMSQLLGVGGTLTRALGTDTVLDCLSKAYVDLRTNSGYADPDLVIMHPATLGAIRREKDAEGRYLADLISAPLSLSAYGAPAERPAGDFNAYSIIPQGTGETSGTLWGAPILATTKMTAGEAVVMSVRSGAAVFWTRLATLLQFNPGYSDSMWSENTMGGNPNRNPHRPRGEG
jgi:hypothetical protein